MKDNPNPTAERLREVIDYDPETGVIRWRIKMSNNPAGKIAGGVWSGYRAIRIDHKSHYAHRLAWAYYHGEWCPVEIDHINGDGTDNRIANLRPATKAENGQNRTRLNRNNTSGHPGVCWDKVNNKWAASIMVDRRSIRLGRFNTIEEAVAARLLAEQELHPFSVAARAA